MTGVERPSRTKYMKVMAVAVASILGGVSIACHDDPADVGMMLGSDGSLQVFGSLCGEDERITSVRIWDGASEEVLWEIESAVGTRDLSFTAGSLPGGFDENVPFNATLDRGDTIGAEMEIRGETRTFRISRVYQVADLRVGSIRAHGDLVEPEDWDDHVAGSVCTTEKGILR